MRKGYKGFTLLEIMVALAIMAVALVTIMQLFSGALRSAKVSHDYSLAVMGVKKKMDEVLAVNTLEEFDELEKGGVFEDEVLKGYEWEIVGPDPYDLPEELIKDIEDVSGSLNDLKEHPYQITVKVKWDSGAHSKEISFTTVKVMEERD